MLPAWSSCASSMHPMSENDRTTGCVFMLPAYSTLRPCFPRLQQALDAGREVWLICATPQLERFLRPLTELGVHVVLIPAPRIRLFRPWHLLAERRRLLGAIESLISAIPPSDVYFYTTGFDLGQMSIVAHFARRSDFSLWFEDRDHTGPMGQRNQRSTAFRDRAFGLAASWVTNAHVEVCYPQEPVPILAKDALEGRFAVVAQASASDIASQQWKVLKPLLRTSPAEVLWLYDDYPGYYGPERVPAELYHELWRSMISTVRQLFPEARQAVKAHPAIQNLPDCFAGCETIDSFVPVEFVELPSVRLVVGSPSLGMQRFIDRPSVRVLCMIEMLTAPAEVLEVERQRLSAWVDPGNQVVRIRSLEEFAQLATSALC